MKQKCWQPQKLALRPSQQGRGSRSLPLAPLSRRNDMMLTATHFLVQKAFSSFGSLKSNDLNPTSFNRNTLQIWSYKCIDIWVALWIWSHNCMQWWSFAPIGAESDISTFVYNPIYQSLTCNNDIWEQEACYTPKLWDSNEFFFYTAVII